MINANYFIERFDAGLPMIAILRGLNRVEAVEQARKAWGLGVRLVEVTLQDDSGYEALRAVVAAAPEGFDVGAGTVTTPEQLRRAKDLGARFGIAPGLDLETVRVAANGQDLNIPFLPGVATASEVQASQNSGAMTVKAFPADVLTPAWLRAMSGPFPGMRFIVTGGVNVDNAATFMAAGAAGVAASMVPEDDRFDNLVGVLRRRS